MQLYIHIFESEISHVIINTSYNIIFKIVLNIYGNKHVKALCYMCSSRLHMFIYIIRNIYKYLWLSKAKKSRTQDKKLF